MSSRCVGPPAETLGEWVTNAIRRTGSTIINSSAHSHAVLRVYCTALLYMLHLPCVCFMLGAAARHGGFTSRTLFYDVVIVQDPTPRERSCYLAVLFCVILVEPPSPSQFRISTPPPPSLGRGHRGLKGSTHLPRYTPLSFWSRRSGQHSRTASTSFVYHRTNSVDYLSLYSRYTLSTDAEARYTRRRTTNPSPVYKPCSLYVVPQR